MDKLGGGRHIGVMYSSVAEKWQRVKPLVQAGLAAGQQVVYVAEESESEEVRAALHNPKGLVVMRAQEAYYPSGTFSPEAMLNLIEKVGKEALEAGYSGLLGMGEMTWMLNDVLGGEQLVEYERDLSMFSQKHKIDTVCLYNRARFGPEMIHLMERIHTQAEGMV